MTKQPETSPTRIDAPFARAFDFILADPNLIPAEKLVMIVVCRYWPRPCTMRRAAIARACGLRPDYVRTLVRWLCAGPDELRRMGRPPRRAYLRQGVMRAGETEEKLLHWLAPTDFPEEEETRIHSRFQKRRA